MSVFYVDLKHEKDTFQICIYLHIGEEKPQFARFPACFPPTGRCANPKSRAQAWSASRVGRSADSAGLDIQISYRLVRVLNRVPCAFF